jgi:tripartite motif-containing protein 71
MASARSHRRGWRAPLALVVLLTLGAGATPSLAASPCAGSGGEACPYAAVAIVGQRAEGMLRFPEAVAVDAQGDVYVADQLSYVVQKFTAAGAFVTQWGSYGGGHGQFGPIGGLAVDAAGNVYVVDSSHNRIQKFDANGNFITDWGRRGNAVGQFNFGSSQNPTQPPGGGIAVAGNYVYVADSGNNRIERFNLQGGEAFAWGSKGSGPGQFSYPRGVAANETEVLVSDDDNHRIEKFSPAGAFEAQAGTASTGPVQLGFPYGVALDAAANVYVADDINHRIVKLTPQLTFAGAWGGFGTKPGQLAFPRALASDPAGDTYVADTANDRVSVFDTNGNFLRTIGTSARGPGGMVGPRGLATDPTGRLLVSDTVDNRIEAFAPGGAFAGQWTEAGGPALAFAQPAGIGVDPRGSVFVADPGNQRVVRLWGEGTFLDELGGPGDVGGAGMSGAGSVAVSASRLQTYVADTNHNRILVYGPERTLEGRWGAQEGNGASGSAAGAFNHPDAVAAAPSGDVYVADTNNNRVVELSPTDIVQRIWGSRGSGDGRFQSPDGIAVDGAGRVYVLDGENNRVQVFSPDGHFLGKWGVRGFGPGEFSQPGAISLGCEGNVYVADTNNNRVEIFNPVNAAPTGCLAAGSWPPPLDVPPVVNVSLARTAGVLSHRALTLRIGCQRGCKVLVTATLGPSGRSGAVALVAAARSIPAGRLGQVALRVGPRSLRRLQRELGRRRGLRTQVKIVAAGPTGRRTTVTRTYALTR